MKIAIIILALLFCRSAYSTAFSLGDGEYWKNICSGIHDEVDEKGAKAVCLMFLVGYQVGAIQQSIIDNTSSFLSGNSNPNTLPQEFIAFVNSDKKYEKMNVGEVLVEFFTQKDK